MNAVSGDVKNMERVPYIVGGILLVLGGIGYALGRSVSDAKAAPWIGAVVFPFGVIYTTIASGRRRETEDGRWNAEPVQPPRVSP